MPAPVTHILLSLLILPLLPDKNPKEFIVGTSFPDIRYLGIVERNVTHIKRPRWAHIVHEKSSFKAGMEFHALVDVIHDNYMRKHHVYNLLPFCCTGSAQYLKFFEDIFLYNKHTKWSEVSQYFDEIYQEELDLVPDTEIVQAWHDILKNYIKDQLTCMAIYDFLSIDYQEWYGIFLKFPIKLHAYYVSAMLTENLDSMMNNNYLCFYIRNFYEQFLMFLGESQKTKLPNVLSRLI